MNFPAEPYRIRMIEPLPRTTRGARERFLADACNNVFRLRARHVTIDLLTDSGTGAMSSNQWAAMMTGDESYAGCESYYQLEEVVSSLTGIPQVIPAHQGRAAEHILFSAIDVRGKTVLSNGHFDTTRANVSFLGGTPLDLPCRDGLSARSDAPFKGNIDLARLESELLRLGDSVALVLMTVTNNSGGGQPASLANLRAASALAHRHGVPMFLDAARFAENAWLIRTREPGQSGRTPAEIAREMFGLADGFTMSAKKNGLVNIGGLLGIRESALADRARALLVLTEGFPTYGGLAGRDLAAMAVGLEEVLDPAYLAHRVSAVQALFDALDGAGVPLMRPAGGHAVYLDAGSFFPQIPAHQLPGVALSNELYLEAGIRAAELGTLMFGTASDPSDHPLFELVRLAIPHRTYTASHLTVVAAAVGRIYERRESVRGLHIAWQAPVLRAFTAKLDPVPAPAAPAEHRSAVPV